MARTGWLAATFSVGLLSAATPALPAQDPHLGHPLKVVEFDPATDRMTAALPFGERFLLKLPVPDGVVAVAVAYGETTKVGVLLVDLPVVDVGTGPLETGNVSFEIPPLDPRKEYRFNVTYRDSVTVPGSLTVKRARESVREVTGKASASGIDHLVTDLGFLRTNRASYWGAVTSVHVYGVPINKSESLSFSDLAFFRRVSGLVGLSIVEFDSDADVEKFFPAGSPVLGMGVRINRVIRVSTGFMFFRQTDPNPLVDKKYTKADHFVSLSLDVDYKALLGPVGAVLGGG